MQDIRVYILPISIFFTPKSLNFGSVPLTRLNTLFHVLVNKYYRGVQIEAKNQQPSINCKVFFHLATLDDIYSLYSILDVYASHLFRLQVEKII